MLGTNSTSAFLLETNWFLKKKCMKKHGDSGAEQGVAVLLGQSLKPDGSAPQVLLDRAQMAKELLHQGQPVMEPTLLGKITEGISKKKCLKLFYC